MLTLIDKTTKTSWFNYFFMFCIIAIYGGYATLFARELGDIRTLGNAFALFITIVFFIKNRIRFNQAFWISILVFLSYAAVTSLNNIMIIFCRIFCFKNVETKNAIQLILGTFMKKIFGLEN